MADLTRGKAEPQDPAAQHGFVSMSPAAIGAPMQVNVPDFSGDHFVEITRWVTRGAVLPAVGDEVLVVKDERGEAWVVAWWPVAGDSPEAPIGTTKGVVVEAEEGDPHVEGPYFTAPRPGGYASVEWVCVKEPINAHNSDTWVNPGRS